MCLNENKIELCVCVGGAVSRRPLVTLPCRRLANVCLCNDALSAEVVQREAEGRQRLMPWKEESLKWPQTDLYWITNTGLHKMKVRSDNREIVPLDRSRSLIIVFIRLRQQFLS
jgi:hypothetical protein